MDDYFEYVASHLTIDDMKVLGYLLDNDATAGFKAIKNSEVMSSTGLTEGTFRRIIYRLSANKFIEIVTLQKMHTLYISDFGSVAIKTAVKGVGA
ncbi:hypothetical protein [Paenibacillus pini]|uniref:Uncharacterized protein n=1 Tax=Paenibacillus pini JCM 16418 TaxID=1236976 RepID=W7YUL1_9BACL|nr:hypothetical protein [Paenibacillus pini]GAF10908.1 hypothetical protein JCM16418_5143 [Paenibacillus pini JCM 16418]